MTMTLIDWSARISAMADALSFPTADFPSTLPTVRTSVPVTRWPYTRNMNTFTTNA